MKIATRITAPCITVALMLFAPVAAQADQFDNYREQVDNYQRYSHAQRDHAIDELEQAQTTDIEKNYLLGMLYFLQGFEAMKDAVRASKKKPRIEDVRKLPEVRRYLDRSEQNYEIVERAQPGYKYVYCKFAELYGRTFNGEGMETLTYRVGKADKNERVAQCQSAIEDTAETFIRYGHEDDAGIIYAAAVKSWNPYPKYMLAALGDIANNHGNADQARAWWKRCVNEADQAGLKQHCVEQLKAPNG